MCAASSRYSPPLSPKGIVRDPVVSAAHASLRPPAARAAQVAACDTSAAVSADDELEDIVSAPFIHESQLKHESDGEHYGDRKQPLRESCGKMDLVHDVLQSVS